MLRQISPKQGATALAVGLNRGKRCAVLTVKYRNICLKADSLNGHLKKPDKNPLKIIQIKWLLVKYILAQRVK